MAISDSAGAAAVPLAADQDTPATKDRLGRSSIMLLVLLTLINILNLIDRQLPYILAESIKRDLSLSDTQLGLLGGIAFALCYSTMAVPLGRLADRWSPKGVLGGCIIFWSMMTAAGGFAQNFAHIAAARVGVAVGEAGCIPAAHALMARRIPLGRRGLALGIFSLGLPTGTMLGLMLGGWINDNSSWRTALIGAGLSGLVLFTLLTFFVADARHGPEQAVVPLRTAVARMVAVPAFRLLLLSVSLVGASLYATFSFSAPFLIRVHGFSTAEAGLWLGLLQGSTGVVGSLWGGRVLDRSMTQNGRHALRAPAIAFLVAGPAAAAAWFVPSSVIAIICLLPVMLALVFFLPASFGIAHRIAGPGQQGVASSVLMLAISLIGGSTGPLAVGMISDALTPSLGGEGLRWALLFVAVTNVLAGVAFLAANRRLGTSRADLSA